MSVAAASVAPSHDAGIFRFYIEAHADPGAVARVVAPFAVLSLVPERLVVNSRTNDLLVIRLDVRGLDADRADHLSARLSQIALVRQVRVALRQR